MNQPSDFQAEKILPVIRLLESTDLSERQIAELTDVAPTTVARYRRIQHQEGYKLSYLETLSPRELRRRFGHARRWRISRGIPQWPDVYRQLCKPGVNLMKIWMEYHEDHPEGYSYPRFISYYGAWMYGLNILHREQRQAGEAIFVGIIEAKIHWKLSNARGLDRADIYYAVLGSSGYTYAHADKSRSKIRWLEFNTKMFEIFGGVPARIERAYVEGGFDLELTFNEDYERLTLHYGTHLAPAFPYGIKLPVGARLVSRFLRSQLGKREFSSLDEINQAVQHLLVRLNHKPFRRLPGCRASWFHQVDRPVLKPLPSEPYKSSGGEHEQH